MPILFPEDQTPYIEKIDQIDLTSTEDFDHNNPSNEQIELEQDIDDLYWTYINVPMKNEQSIKTLPFHHHKITHPHRRFPFD